MRDATKAAPKIEEYGIKINGQVINNLRYADDTVLIADTHVAMQELLHVNQVDSTRNETGLSLNAKKTKVMHVRKDRQ